MSKLFEYSDSLNNPIECFVFTANAGNFPVKSHWHYFTEMMYMLEGEAEVRAGENTYVLSSGEMIIFHSSVIHSIRACGEGFPKYAVLKFDMNKFNLTPPYAPKIRDIFRHAMARGMCERFDTASAEALDCRRVFDVCVSEMAEYKYGRDLMLQSAIYGLLMNIIRRYLSDGLTIDGSLSRRDDYAIENITEYIDLSLSDKPSVSEIARRCNMSYSCFARRFKEQYGMSCKQYIERMRIYKAEDYLLFTDSDLNFISQETGFSDCSHLIRCFRKYRGMTPNHFRRNASANIEQEQEQSE